jgi:hypothetical protein
MVIRPYFRFTSPPWVIRQALTMSSSLGMTRTRLLVDDQLQEVEQVARVERRGVGRHGGGQIGLADDRHAVHLDGLVGDRERAVAPHATGAASGGDVDDHRARLHALDHRLADQRGGRATGNQRRADHHVGRRHALGHLGGLALQPARRHGFGVAAHALRGLALFVGLVGHLDELGAQGFDLLLHRRPHIAGLDDRAEPLGRGDGLQARHAHAQDDDARRLDGAGRRHQHREQLGVVHGGQHHRLVAGQVGLAGQHVQALRARGARRGLEREGGQAGAGQLLQALGVEGVEQAQQHAAAFHQRQLGCAGPLHLQHQLGGQGAGRVGQLGAGRLVGGVGAGGGVAGVAFHQHAVAGGLQLLGGFRGDRHPGLAGRALARHSNQHAASSSKGRRSLHAAFDRTSQGKHAPACVDEARPLVSNRCRSGVPVS